MASNQDIENSLICAVREGKLERARELIYTYGLSYSKAWLHGYNLLCYAVQNNHIEIVKLLLTSGSKVNSKENHICKSMPYNNPLFFAVQKSDIKIVKMLLDKGANIETKDPYGQTPLQNAIFYKNLEAIKLLLKYGANVNAIEFYGRTPLHTAIERRLNLEAIKLLLKYGANVNAIDRHGKRPLHTAIEWGTLPIIKHLLKNGAFINYGCSRRKGYAPLHIAVEFGKKDAIMLLLSKGANVNVKGKDNTTPLHIAARRKFTCIAEYLLNHGACIHSLTLKKGYTPLHLACKFYDDAIVKLLLERGADVNANSKDNLTPLHIATERNTHAVVKVLLQHGARVDNESKDGKTILNVAVENGLFLTVKNVLKSCPDINNQKNRSSLKIAVFGEGPGYDYVGSDSIVKILLEYGFVVNPEDANNPKLLHTAIKKGYFKIIEDLLKYGADVNLLDNSTYEGFTPLHNAVKHKQEEVTELLINYKAAINAHDKTEKTPLFYAIENGDLKTIKLLLNNKACVHPELLNIAVKNGCIEMVEVFLQHNADINATDEYGRINVNAKQSDGKTALHIAIEQGHTNVVKLLLEYGANANFKTTSGITPLHFCAEKGLKEIIEIILMFGANINARDEKGRTALHIASQHCRVEVVKTLLDYGCDINITSKNGSTPFDWPDPELRLRNIELQFYEGEQQNYDDIDDYFGDDLDTDYEHVYPVNFNPNYFEGIVIEPIKRHIVKMKTANLYVSERNLYRSDSHELRDFKDKCEKEIECMKNEQINKTNISFYDILVKLDKSSLPTYVSNENVIQVLKAGGYKTKFPIYATMIESHFSKGIKRKELLDQGNEIFRFLFNGFTKLPHDCTEKILSYLSDEELNNFNECLQA